MRPRSAICAGLFVLAGMTNAVFFAIVTVTKITNGVARLYLDMLLLAVSAVACFVAALSVLDRRRGDRPSRRRRGRRAGRDPLSIAMDIKHGDADD